MRCRMVFSRRASSSAKGPAPPTRRACRSVFNSLRPPIAHIRFAANEAAAASVEIVERGALSLGQLHAPGQWFALRPSAQLSPTKRPRAWPTAKWCAAPDTTRTGRALHQCRERKRATTGGFSHLAARRCRSPRRAGRLAVECRVIASWSNPSGVCSPRNKKASDLGRWPSI